MASWNDVLGSGIPKTAGQSPATRKELRDLTAEERYLFAEGLARFQQQDLDKVRQAADTYYEIAGIHGLPYRRWPNEDWNKDMAEEPTEQQTQAGRGFCTHTSILFLTWHRPYLALFEAKLHENVRLIAEGISPADGQDRYVATAKTFRLPYWDWARVDRYIFPTEALDATQKWWSGPKSTNSVWPKTGVYNPLHQAPLPTNAPQALLDMGNPTQRQNATGGSDKKRDHELWARVKQIQTQHKGSDIYATDVVAARNLSERVANILGAYQRFAPVSHNKYSLQGQTKEQRTARKEVWGSLEDIHNAIHNLVGNEGQMGTIAASAFDPIFWLHHSNIDRLFALWQGLHEDPENAECWVTKQAYSPTFLKLTSKDDDDDTTKLWPFKYFDAKTQSLEWYTSAQTHNVEDFNYTYPELVGLQSLPLNTRRKQLIPAIDALYPQPGDDIAASFLNDPQAGARMLPQAFTIKTMAVNNIQATAVKGMEVVAALPEPQVLLTESLKPEKPFLRDLAPQGKFLDWIVNIKAEKHALGGKYVVYVFLDAVEEDDVSLWPLSPHFVGLFAPLGQAVGTGCGKCQIAQDEKLQVTGQIPLTVALMERYMAQMIPDLTADTVVPYLAKNLHWRIAVDHQALDDRSQVPGLTVFVISNEVTVTEPADELPIFSDEVTIHAEATTNLSGSGRGNGTGLAVGEEGT